MKLYLLSLLDAIALSIMSPNLVWVHVPMHTIIWFQVTIAMLLTIGWYSTTGVDFQSFSPLNESRANVGVDLRTQQVYV